LSILPFTLVNPYLYTDDTNTWGVSTSNVEVNVSAECVEWHRAFNHFFAASHFGVVQTASYFDTNTFSASVHGVLSAHLSCAAEVNSAFKLARDVFGYQFSV